MKKPATKKGNGQAHPNRTTRLELLEGGVLIAVTNYPHLERVLPEVFAMIERSRRAGALL
jgi:hypothetical protein